MRALSQVTVIALFAVALVAASFIVPASAVAEDTSIACKLKSMVDDMTAEQQAALLLLLSSLKAETAAVAAAPPMSDDDMVKKAIDDLAAAVLGLDVKALLDMVSDDFEHPQVGGKDELEAFIDMGFDVDQAKSFVEDGEISHEDVEIEYEDDGKTAICYPIDASAAMGAISVEIIFQKEDGVWKIIELNPDGV